MKMSWIGSTMLAALLPAFACSARGQSPTPDAVADLGGTSWQLVRFESSDDKTLTPDDKAKYTIVFGTDGSVIARIDCNRGRGTWKSAGPNQLQFGPLALTRAMCPPAPLNDRLPKDWQYVRSYIMKDTHLFLSLMADGGIYEFEPISGSKPIATNSTMASNGPVTYECTQTGGGRETLTATFYQTTPGLVLVEHGNQTRPAFQVRSGSGANYEGKDLMFWEAHGEAMVTWSVSISGASHNRAPGT
jgi:heat shock protein HslJ/membrane-bound inhibitor of C-type lysozyme